MLQINDVDVKMRTGSQEDMETLNGRALAIPNTLYGSQLPECVHY